MTTKQDLHRLIDELPESAVAEAARLLAALRAEEDPVLRAFLEAPEDDEPETEEERAAVEEARAEIVRGEVVPWEEVEARLFPEDRQ
jgi:hypothetical protein